MGQTLAELLAMVEAAMTPEGHRNGPRSDEQGSAGVVGRSDEREGGR